MREGKRGRRPGFAALLTVLTVLAGGGAAATAAQEAELAGVRREVADLRELSFLAEVEPVYLDRGQLRRRLIGLLRAQGASRDIPGSTRALHAFGLVPEGTPLAPLQLDAATVAILRLYVLETDEMILIGKDDGSLGALEEWTYAHELVHALQDQRFGLDALFAERLTADDDAGLALGALVEGDASAVDTAYLEAHPELTAGLLGSLLGTLPGALGLEAPPPLLVHTGSFTYGDGEAFVAALRAEGGWGAVDAAYADPPRSTEQILHPEKYHGDRDDPTPVALPDLGPALGTGWDRVHENALGELQTAVLLADQAPGAFAPLPAAASGAAAGWDGDRYALWSNGDGEILVWRSVWDGADEAVAFVDALKAMDEARMGGRWTAAGGTALVGADGAVQVRRVGAEVAYVRAPDLALADVAMAALRGVEPSRDWASPPIPRFLCGGEQERTCIEPPATQTDARPVFD